MSTRLKEVEISVLSFILEHEAFFSLYCVHKHSKDSLASYFSAGFMPNVYHT